uniref:Transcription termination factor Rho n=1 Tax=Mesoaciditoga lauensis TaxID=1495039 RepID=A0A7V3RFH3_9BACT
MRKESFVTEEKEREHSRFSKDADIKKLEDLKIKELYEIAKSLGIQRFAQYRKEDLIFEILKAQSESNGYKFKEGVLKIQDGGGYGLLRVDSYTSTANDIYVSPSQIKRFGLMDGDTVSGQTRPPKEGEKYFALLKIEAINYQPIELSNDRINFENLTPLYPQDRFVLETEPQFYDTRLIDIFAPIGKGQRGLIVSPPKAGKTTILKHIANGIAKNHPSTKRMVLLIDERPEEVTDMKRSVNAEVIAAPFDMPSDKQIEIAEFAIEKAKRLVEYKYDVVILLDSITRLARAYNLYLPPSGKLLSGGVDASALYKPKHFFGAARNIEEGGSLTIIATALVETGSKMDDVIFEEFKGTGNMELVLSRQLANKRIFPAIDLNLSGTRKEELLLNERTIKNVWLLRRFIGSMNPEEAINLMISKLKETKTNDDFFDLLKNEKDSVR